MIEKIKYGLITLFGIFLGYVMTPDEFKYFKKNKGLYFSAVLFVPMVILLYLFFK